MKKNLFLLFVMLIGSLLCFNVSAEIVLTDDNVDSYVGKTIIDINSVVDIDKNRLGKKPYEVFNYKANGGCVNYVCARHWEKLKITYGVNGSTGNGRDCASRHVNGKQMTSMETGITYTIRTYFNDAGANIKANSWVSFETSSKGYENLGHVVFVEYVKVDENGVKQIYYTENVNAGVLKKATLEKFVGGNLSSWATTYLGTACYEVDGSDSASSSFYTEYNGTYYIVSSLNGEKSTIGVVGDSKNSKANVHLWTRHTGDSQKWELKKSGNYYTITNVRSGKALDVYDASTTSGTNVWQYDVNGTQAQQWSIEDAGNGYVYIKSALGNYLDVSGGKSDNGTNIQVYKGNQTAAQKFKLVPAYYLDLNGKLDGTNSNTTDGYGRADVYIDGKLVADNVTDYYMLIASDSKYEIKDINPAPGYIFDGIVEGASSGTMREGKRSITLSFSKKHTHNYSMFDYQTDHPHRGYKKCSCGDIQYTEAYAIDNNCKICNPVKTVNVYYNANGGNEPPSPQSVVVGESVRISNETLTRNGYEFLGWSLNSNAATLAYTGGEVIYPNSDMTLYAVWKKDSNASKFILRIGHTEASVFGVTKYNDVAPILENHRTMLPARFVAENLGATVSWDDPTQTVTISKGNILIEIVIGSNYAYVNGEPRYIDTPAFLRNSRTYTPVRFICESLGAMVDWEEETQSVIITI